MHATFGTCAAHGNEPAHPPASQPPEWQGWMNHTLDQAPTEVSLTKFAWQKEHQPNQTGSPGAYVPEGDPRTAKPRAATTGDYQAWNPNEAG